MTLARFVNYGCAMKIETNQVHAALYCVYDREGTLLAAFPTEGAAQAYRDLVAYGAEQ